VSLDCESNLDFTGAKNLDTAAIKKTLCCEHARCDLAASLKLIEGCDIDTKEGATGRVLESALWKATEKRHLATFEAELRLVTLASILTLMTAT
jgi:hypothetical protein